MLIYSIYKATNKTNGKVYIGFDSNWPKRFHVHRHRCGYKDYTSSNFYNAIRKYGWENFTWEIIYQSPDGEHCKNVMENFFIKEYRSYIGFDDCNGYNMTLGGDGTFGYNDNKTPEHKQKISEALTGKPKSKEHIENFRKSRCRIYKMIDPNGNIIEIENMAEFCRKNNLNQSHMNSVCRGSYGFISHKGYKKYNE